MLPIACGLPPGLATNLYACHVTRTQTCVHGQTQQTTFGPNERFSLPPDPPRQEFYDKSVRKLPLSFVHRLQPWIDFVTSAGLSKTLAKAFLRKVADYITIMWNTDRVAVFTMPLATCCPGYW
ncbi:hypothetical protein BaRGS_00024712 [Batillaria attramentaria]|uniref:Uncharacterized protein n=1 Tax=Batillaria attramentaria TaxID=370345 RepID=A0ABD0KAS0_9CAEN